MKTSLNKSWLKVGLASVILTVSGGLAVAQISVVDGLPLTPVQSGAGSSVGAQFTVSSGVDALVVEVYSRDSQNTTDPGPTAGVTWMDGTFSPQTMVEGVGEVNGAGSYAWNDIFYLFNPTPGTANITFTDTTATMQGGGMAMLVFDLTGVDTTVTPAAYANNLASGVSLSIATGAGTPAGAFAALTASYGNNGNPFTFTTSDTGTLNYLTQGALAEAGFGYEQNLSGGATTITASVSTGGDSKMALAGLVFSPANVIPEPSSGLLFGAGTAIYGLMSLIRRKIS